MKKFQSGRLAILLLLLTIMTGVISAQETTGAIQGTVKDASGAVIPGATVTVATPTLVGTKTLLSDGKGYYHFSNLPPGPYTITAEAKGFASIKRNDVVLEVGRSPSVDLTLAAGAQSTVVEVTSQAPTIDVTSVTTQSNITKDVLTYVPTGTSFQSVIQFAPSASNEPLMGGTSTTGNGSVSPGSATNGNAYGYSIGGGADSENSYLVEGQETADLIGGYSHTNVPIDFIDQVQVKTSGIQAEYGGALGGVINVIMKKGSPHYHGSVFLSFQDSSLDAGPNAQARYDPLGNETPTSWTSQANFLPVCAAPAGSPAGTSPPTPPAVPACVPAAYQGNLDAAYQSYQPIKSGMSDIFPGFTLGGPLLPMVSRFRDKMFFFVSFNPELNRLSDNINYGPASAGNPATGVLPYSQNTNSYYTTARVDVQATQKIRVFGSWLYQLQKQYGEHLPNADSVQGYNYTTKTGYFNDSVQSPTSSFAHTLGYTAPNLTVNTGADIAITSHIVSTTRFGYYFENYHDFGYPTGGDVFVFQTNGVGATDATGAPLPASLQQANGYQTGALDNLTSYNASKAIQLDQDISWYKSTGFGTHNFKFGYQLNRESNTISQVYNEPYLQPYVGDGGAASYSPQTSTGTTNCAPYIALYGNCQGKYGYLNLYDYGTGGSAISYNHSIYGQDSWTIGRGVTIDAGVRAEHEFLPGEIEGYSASVVPPHPINFGWKQKIAPRIGVAWDVFRNGKMKVFGSYGVFDDQMKLNLAISSFGGQYWNNCAYALNTSNLSSISVPFVSYNGGRRYCAGPDSSANAALSATPSGLTFLENVNNRAATPTCSTCNPYEEAVAPNLKPYQQHESVFGTDYQLSPGLAFEARWDRRRLDHVIEDSAIYNPSIGETFVIVNPGQGVDSTFEGFCDFLYSTDPSGCVSGSGQYPQTNIIPAARSYDGVEFRLTKTTSSRWGGMFSYTYSHFRGNYTGLTSSDLADGSTGGRNAPNNSRSFDEPYFSWNDNGGSASGLLPTDRPNKVKGYAYYRLGFLRRYTTDFGIFQYLYQGSPNTTYANVGLSYNAFPVDVVDRGKWVNIAQDSSTGALTVGNPYTYRNPWYDQTDFNITQSFKVGESKNFNVQATFTNLLNEHSVTAINEQVDSAYGGGNQYITPQGYNTAEGVPFYTAAQSPYNLQNSLNGVLIGGQPSNVTASGGDGPETLNSQYGKPLYYQLPRTIRLAFHYEF
jgi:hypothetical protein